MENKEIKKPASKRPEGENTKAGVYEDLEGRANLLVSFGGGKGGLGVPVFEFYKTIAHLDCDKIFVRDFRQEYYQKGVDNNIDDIEKLVAYFREKVEQGNYQRIICIGNSMGGYASILFGTLMNADRVLSFAPQTFIDWATKLRYFDFRAPGGHLRINLDKNKKKKYFDLRKHLNRIGDYKTQISVFYDPNYKIDKIHIERLGECRNVKLVAYDEGGHDVVKVIKKRGHLIPLIEEAVQG